MLCEAKQRGAIALGFETKQKQTVKQKQIDTPKHLHNVWHNEPKASATARASTYRKHLNK